MWKRAVLGLLLLAIFAGMAFLTRPWSFLCEAGQTIQVLPIRDETPVENFAALPANQAETYRVSPETSGYQVLAACLETAAYSPCLHTLYARWFPEGYSQGLLWVSWPGFSVYPSQSSSHLIVDGRVFRSSSAAALYQACMEAAAQNPPPQ